MGRTFKPVCPRRRPRPTPRLRRRVPRHALSRSPGLPARLSVASSFAILRQCRISLMVTVGDGVMANISRCFFGTFFRSMTARMPDFATHSFGCGKISSFMIFIRCESNWSPTVVWMGERCNGATQSCARPSCGERRTSKSGMELAQKAPPRDPPHRRRGSLCWLSGYASTP
jgi:hypothetical protein